MARTLQKSTLSPPFRRAIRSLERTRDSPPRLYRTQTRGALEISLRYGRVFHLARSRGEMCMPRVGENGNESGIGRTQRGILRKLHGKRSIVARVVIKG